MADIVRITANLWNGEYEIGGYSESTGQKIENENLYRNSGYIEVKPNETYIFSTNNSSFRFSRFFYYDANKNYLSTTTSMGTITIPTNAHFVNFHSGTLKTTYPDGLYDSMLNLGTDALSYQPYHPHSLKKFDGTTWQDAAVKEYDGTNWN